MGARVGPARAAHRGPGRTDLVAGRLGGAAGRDGLRLRLPVGVVCGAEPADQDDRHGADPLHRSRLLDAVERGLAGGRGAGCRSWWRAAGCRSRRGAATRACSSALACCSICSRLPLATCWCSSRRAGPLTGERSGAGAGPGSRAALAPFTARSAFPVQLPALDQCADHSRSTGGAADVSAARRVPARDARARERAGLRWRASSSWSTAFWQSSGSDSAIGWTSTWRLTRARRPAWCRRCSCSRSSRMP